MGTASGFNLIKFFQLFCVQNEKIPFFTKKKRARTANQSLPLDSAGKNTSKYVLWKIFLEFIKVVYV